MGLTFLVPAFFLGLTALAVPLLVHLTHRERKDVVQFPSLMFLRRIPYRSVRRQRIRNWLLFALRCAFIVLLALAFARPLVDRPMQAATSILGARELVILLDRSFSMGYEDRWERALAAARRAVDGVGPEDRATVIFFATDATAANQATGDRAILHAALEGVSLSAERTRYGPALQLAERLLAQSERPRREVVLITDFQQTAWDGEEDILFPRRTQFDWVDLASDDPSNLSVATVFLSREYRSGRERISVSARVVNAGARPVEKVAVSLDLNDRAMGEQTVSVEPHGAATVTFDPLTLPAGQTRGTVRLTPDALPQDDAFHFVLFPGQAISVLAVEPATANDKHSLYLRQALALGDRPAFRLDVRRVSRLRAADLDGRAIVVLNDVPPPAGALGQRLATFVSEGGGLLVALGGGAGPDPWPAGLREAAPPLRGAVVDRSAARGGTLASLDYGHPVFELFSRPRSGDFSAARFFRYRRLQREPEVGVLARFDDGSAALIESSFGKGRVLIWTSKFDNTWNDLAVQPVFLPFAHQLLRYTGGYVEPRAWFTAGEVVEAGAQLALADPGRATQALAPAELLVVSPSGKRERVPVTAQGQYVRPVEHGFYQIRGVMDDDGPRGLLASNVDPAESNLSRLDPQELASAVTTRGGEVAPVTLAELPAEDRESRQRLWWYLLVAALMVLVAETLVANRKGMRRRAAVAV